VKAVNLIPADSRKGGGGSSSASQLASYGLFGILAAALVLVTLYVLANNSISDRQSRLTTLRTEVAQAQSEASRLGTYSQFQQLARTRVQTVQDIAATRFDWHSALTDLSRVVPANTSLQSLAATVAPGASAGGSGAAAAGNLRTAVSAPAFELAGCTSSQDDVARLMSRLRLIDGVSRVTLGSSTKTGPAQTGAGAPSPTSAASTPAVGCGPNKPTFDVIVFFQPLAGAGPMGATSIRTATTSGGTK
jgi:Tfp pilus assembly protein PilN